MRRLSPPALVALYLVAVVLANLSVAAFGPPAVLWNAFLLVALSLTTRDPLHDAWAGRGLWWRMLALIGAGSLISAALSWQAAPVALASLGAFLLAGAADTLAYHAARPWPWLARVNASNAAGAAVDSAAFLGLLAALGGLPWALVLPLAAGQVAAKVAGGALWSLLLRPRTEPRHAIP